ncbi:hypothetical protein SEUCBS139899_002135 [Sporothrix eucalyptigena]|uniref:Methyltransferase domain-containing protein n=1 Tax=Sporothrix eucalyptigena TaxID=1812306 RepID=A0ABP0B4E0_9PEZI
MTASGDDKHPSSSDVASTAAAAALPKETAPETPQAAAASTSATSEAAKAAEAAPEATPATTEAAVPAEASAIPPVLESALAAALASGSAPAPVPGADEVIVPAQTADGQTTETETTEGTDDVVGFSDTDSAVGSLDFTSLASLTDSIREFRHENGRTYHSLSAGKYWCPNDDPENSRLDLQHHAHRLTFDGALCCCPKEAGAKRVLDLGTGTGIWSMEYADEHPEAEVIGVDLSPIQPEFVPPNCSFEVDDIEKEWTWSKPFDFIWWRALLGCFSDAQAMVQKCFDNLEPGGYLEMHDGTFPPECDDGTMPEDCALLRLANLAKDASASLGRPIDVSPQYAKMMENAGFVDVVFAKYKWPTNGWPRDKKMKTLGHWTLANVEPGLEGLFLALLTRGMGMSAEETTVLCAEARKDLRNPAIHAYWPAYYCYGRKPE